MTIGIDDGLGTAGPRQAQSRLSAAHHVPPWHLALGVTVIAVWGTNFVVVDTALKAFSPLTLAALRFTLSALPWIIFVRRPALPWRWLALYGLLAALQYALLYLALGRSISPGLASVVLQAQVFFTVALAAVQGREFVSRQILAAMLLAATGLMIIAVYAGGSATPVGLSLTLGAAASWALANAVSRIVHGVNAFAFVIWCSAFAAPPLILLALLPEGWSSILASLQNANALSWAAVLWQSLANNVLGFGVWAWLLGRHPAAAIAPIALLVPIFGLGAAAQFIGETLPVWKLAGTALVMIGLGWNMAATIRRARPLPLLNGKAGP